jgi:hypothetical protein
MSFTRPTIILPPKCPETCDKRVRGIMGMVGQVEGKSPLTRCENRWDDNIKMNLNALK